MREVALSNLGLDPVFFDREEQDFGPGLDCPAVGRR